MLLTIGKAELGFTLIELSIVLVIIGLIVGGVITGRDLIKAAEVRATITQFEKFNQAVNTFYNKYGALPGDLNAVTAQKFGFASRGSTPGQGDGNGIIEGFGSSYDSEGPTQNGETEMFWEDLTTANGLNVNLIDGSFSTAQATTLYPAPATGASIGLYLPAAKLGGSNYFYVWSGGPLLSCCPEIKGDGRNYFGLSAVTAIDTPSPFIYSSPGLTVKQASAIDTKVDDGMPLFGNVKAVYLNVFVAWAGANSQAIAVTGSSTTCYDNAGVAGNPFNYSVNQNGGVNVNCALSFRFQ